MALKPDRKTYAAETSEENGPTFGTGDLSINLNQSDIQNESQSLLGSSYFLPIQINGSKEWQQTLLAGKEFFMPDDVEVFYLYSKEPTFVFLLLRKLKTILMYVGWNSGTKT